MQDIWNRIESWLAVNAPTVLASLQPGATEEEIQQTEAILGVQLAEEIKASFRIHNGQLDHAETLIPYRLSPEDLAYVETSPSSGWQLLSLKNVVNEWNLWIELLEAGEAEWNRFWVPIAHDEGGNYYCLNLDSQSEDQFEQVILANHEEIPKIEVVAPGFRQWLNQFAIDLESGIYEYAEEFSCLVDAEELKLIRLNRALLEAKNRELSREQGFNF